MAEIETETQAEYAAKQAANEEKLKKPECGGGVDDERVVNGLGIGVGSATGGDFDVSSVRQWPVVVDNPIA